jgi:serine/threonine protein kinase
MDWKESWVELSSIDGGAQGDCFSVKRKGGDDTVFFLKRLKDGGNSERRSRFYFETMLHNAYKINHTTEIIETNSENFEDKSIDLYYVAKFVLGQRLDKFVGKQNITEELATDIFRQLLVILADCHQQGIVHRDIKPENIIINDGVIHLVDFGIASSSIKNSDTKIGQEIGNRFLRLPEFSAGSMSKRDARSDITLACGIAVYLFSGKYPRVLQTENGSFPHQTQTSSEIIGSLKFRTIWNVIFDRAFIPNLSYRWSSCEEVLELLDGMKSKNESEIDELKKQLKLYSQRHSSEYLRQLSQDLSSVYKQAYQAVKNVCMEGRGGFNIQEQSWVYNQGDEVRKSQIRFHKLGASCTKKYLSVIISAELIGEQIVAYIDIDDNRVEIGRFPTKSDAQAIIFNKESIEKNVFSSLVEFTQSA